jgi:hypothetical protein
MILTIPQAMERLQIGSRRQLSKLLDTGLLASLEATEVDAIAAWPLLELAPDECGIAVHLSSYQEEEQSNDPDDGSQRRWYGWERGNPLGLMQRDIDRGWVGYWPVSKVRATELQGGFLVGSIAGFIPRDLVRRIEGFVSFPIEETSRIVFEVSKLNKTNLDRIGNRRIVAKRGGIWQTL